jgi:NifU-like protein involved in Fe-S cluster formation
MLRLCARVEGERLAAVTFKARGCVASIGAASALTELIIGRTPQSLLDLKAGDVEEAVGGLEPESKHAAQLCIDGVRALHAAWRKV